MISAWLRLIVFSSGHSHSWLRPITWFPALIRIWPPEGREINSEDGAGSRVEATQSVVIWTHVRGKLPPASLYPIGYMDSSESSESNSAEEESESIQSPDSPHVNLKLYTKNYDLHRITVSTTARFCPDVAQPAMNVLEDSQFWVDPTAADKVLNIPLIRNHLVNEGRMASQISPN